MWNLEILITPLTHRCILSHWLNTHTPFSLWKYVLWWSIFICKCHIFKWLFVIYLPLTPPLSCVLLISWDLIQTQPISLKYTFTKIKYHSYNIAINTTEYILHVYKLMRTDRRNMSAGLHKFINHRKTLQKCSDFLTF